MIPNFKTDRLDVELKEITIGAIIELASIPILKNERGLTVFLNNVVKNANRPVVDWTVNERYACFIHYMIATVGDSSDESGIRFSDYLTGIPSMLEHDDFGNEIRPTFETVEMLEGGEEKVHKYQIQRLTTEYLEAIEELVQGGAVRGHEGAAAYELAAIAAQVIEEGATDQAENGLIIQELVHARINAVLECTESEYEELRNNWLRGNAPDNPYVNIAWGRDGVVCVCANPSKGETEAGEIPVARFCFHALISERARETWGQSV